MITVIPCAGIGSRLGVPVKELHEVGGRPMIDYVVEVALAYGSRDLLLIIRPGKEKLAKYVAERTGARVLTIYQNEPLGTGHALSLLRGLLSGENLLYLMPDVIIRSEDEDRPALPQLAGNLNERAWVYLWRTRHPEQKGCFRINAEGRVQNHVEKQVPKWMSEIDALQVPQSRPSYLAWNAAVLTPSFVELCADAWRHDTWRIWAERNRGSDAEFAIDDGFDLCLERGYRLTGIRANGFAQDCGTPEGIEKAEALLKGGA